MVSYQLAPKRLLEVSGQDPDAEVHVGRPNSTRPCSCDCQSSPPISLGYHLHLMDISREPRVRFLVLLLLCSQAGEATPILQGLQGSYGRISGGCGQTRKTRWAWPPSKPPIECGLRSLPTASGRLPAVDAPCVGSC